MDVHNIKNKVQDCVPGTGSGDIYRRMTVTVRRWACLAMLVCVFAAVANSQSSVAAAEREWKRTIATSTDPYELADANFRLGYNRFVEKMHDEAETYLSAAIRHASRMRDSPNMAKLLRGQSLFYRARNAHQSKGAGNETIGMYTLVLEERPDHFEALHWRGHAYLDSNKLKEAEADFTNAIASRTPEIEGLSGLDSIVNALADGSIEGDFDDYKKELQDLFMDRSQALLGLKQNEASLADATRAVKLGPASARAFYRQGSANAALGKPDAAMTDLNKAIELKNNYADAYVERGRIFETRKQLAEAAADYTSAIEHSPRWYKGYWLRAFARVQLDQLEGAYSDASKAAEMMPREPNAFALRGSLALELKKYVEAESDLLRYFELGGNDIANYGLLGTSQQKLKKYDAAVTSLTRAIESDQKNAALFAERGISYFGSNRMDAALADFTKAIAMHAKPTESLYYRARIYFVQDKLPLALADINKAIAFEPSADHFELRASIHCVAGRKALAKADERKITSLGKKVAEPCM